MNYLRKLRKEKGMSQQKLAELLDVNQTAISQWERGITTPSSRMMLKLSQLFDVNPFELINNEENTLGGYEKNVARHELSERLKRLREEKGLTAADLSTKAGVSVVALTGYEQGAVLPPPDVMDRLCRVLRVSREYLLGQTNDKSAKLAEKKLDVEQICNAALPIVNEKATPALSEEALKIAEIYDTLDDKWKEIFHSLILDKAESQSKEKVIRYVVPSIQRSPELPQPPTYYTASRYSHPMSAGLGEEAGDDGPEDFMLAKQPPRGTSYVAPVSGDSMEPTFHDGDELFVHACSEIVPGQIGVFLMDGKQWVKELGDGVLVSHNPKYAPIPMTEDIRCQGLVLGVCDPTYFP